MSFGTGFQLKGGLLLFALSVGGTLAFAGMPGRIVGRTAYPARAIQDMSAALRPASYRPFGQVDPPVWLEQRVTASPRYDYDNFGYSVAVDGATAFVADAFGTVYVFTQSGGVWTQTQYLTAGDGDTSFGWSLVVHGNTAFIGAPYGTTGAVYVFTELDGTWTQTQELTPSDGNTNFGSSVAFGGATAIIGAATLTGSSPGAAYVVTESAGVWTQAQKFTPSDGGTDFGASVALDGATIMVGEPRFYQDILPGTVYVFSESDGTWTQTQELTAGDAEAEDLFGDSVALDGTTAFVGAEGQSNCQGAAYVFGESGGNWTQTQKLTASDGEAGDCFGSGVALDGAISLIAAGSYNNNEGKAYVFSESGANWTQTQTFNDSEGYGGENFAASAALAGTTALIGAPYDGGFLQGAAYFYGQSDLGLAVSAPQTVNQGQQYVSQSIVTNNASAASPAVAVKVAVPAAASFVSASATQGTCSEELGVVTCGFGQISGGAGTATANVTLKAIGDIGTRIENRARVAKAIPPLTAGAPTTITAGGACPEGYTEYDGALSPGEVAHSPVYQAPSGEEDAILTAPSGFELYAVYQSGRYGRHVYRVPGNEVHRRGPKGLYLWLVRARDATGAYTLCLQHP